MLRQPTACSFKCRLRTRCRITCPRIRPWCVRSKPSQVQCISPPVSTEDTYLLAGSRYRRCTAARCIVFMVILCVTVDRERCYSSSHPSDCELCFFYRRAQPGSAYSVSSPEFHLSNRCSLSSCSIHLLLLRSAPGH